MKIREVRLQRFKRFTDLTIRDLPESAKLIVLAGPNGCGKSSFFDALHIWHRLAWSGRGGSWEEAYYVKDIGQARLQWNQSVTVHFHGAQPADPIARKKAIYARSAYRNDPQFHVRQLNRQGAALDEDRFQRLIENDASVAKNYERLASQGLEDLYEARPGDTTFQQYREESVGTIRDAMQRLFPGLILKGVGNPLREGTFRFDKGTSRGFSYMNLSGGEKAAFDLVLDLAVKTREFDDTVFLIDEPEAHMNTRLQAALLQELMLLVPDHSQLWLATHSIGMMRQARDHYIARPDQCVFLNFDGRNFDIPQELHPTPPNRSFWQNLLNVALADLADLVAPERVVICEGTPNAVGARNAEHDARCYDTIFANSAPEVKFLAGGNSHDVQSDRIALVQAIEALVRGANVLRLIDRDDRSVEEIEALRAAGVRVLGRRNLEGYLFDDAILSALCASEGHPEITPALLHAKTEASVAAIARGAPADDLKRASGEIYNAARRLLGLQGRGNDAKAFMRSTLAPLVLPGTPVYEELRADIFS